jgi:hypothetical protein
VDILILGTSVYVIKNIQIEAKPLTLTVLQGKQDFQALQKTPTVWLSQNVGHQVYQAWHPLIIEWLNWHLKGEGVEAAKAKFLGNGTLAPFTEHESKNWK